jgi:tetratricopeptide (TPR) repeat protein
VRDFIRPASVEMPDLLKDIMGWDQKLLARAAAPQYPCLIDQKHVVGELYDIINVPMTVWIDEQGRIVRPAESAGVNDAVRSLDPQTFTLPTEIAAEGKRLRTSYVDAIRDWVAKGERSEFVLSAEEARRRTQVPADTDALAMANFRLGEHLFERGHRDAALKYFAEARRLRPDSWTFIRQTFELEQAGKASGPEFFAMVQALGADQYYYKPVDLKPSAK